MGPRRARSTGKAAEIISRSFQPPDGRLFDVEVKQAHVEAGRASLPFVEAPERLDFYCFIYVLSGTLRHRVDFDELRCGPGSVLAIRPGQVHQFDLRATWRGWLALFRPEVIRGERGHDDLAVASGLNALPPYLRLEPAEQAAVEELLSRMAEDSRNVSAARELYPLLRSQLQVLLLRLKRAQARGEPVPRDPDVARRYRQFAAAVEAHFSRVHEVAWYARTLRCAERTLTRASLHGSGVPAKEFIARRVLLEAKRMLAHTSMPASDIALTLGFEEPTHFGKFFRRKAGCTPGAFRDRYRPA